MQVAKWGVITIVAHGGVADVVGVDGLWLGLGFDGCRGC